jgi:IS30 family transposase
MTVPTPKLQKLKLPLTEIERLYVDEKMTLREIAARTGVSHQDIHHHLKALGVERRNRKTRRRTYPRFDRETMYDLYVTQGLSMEEIGRRLGLSSITIKKELDAHGIKSGRWRQRTPETEALEGEAVELYKRGWSVKQIAAHFDKYPEAIYNALARGGIELRYLKLVQRELDYEELKRLYVDEQRPVKTICKILRVTRNKLENELIRHGIPIRAHKRQIKHPQLASLEIGQAAVFPRTGKLNYHKPFYDDARKLGIQVTIQTVDRDSVRVVRVSG